jgi:uncharacterized protein with GYD domain
MAKYLIEETIAPPGYAGMLQKPEDRSKAIRPLFEAAGCKLEHFYVSLIDNKTYLIIESPDLISANTLTANFMAGGGLSSIKCTPIVAVSEAVDLFKKAASLTYRPPGK